jgi:hypothetical protein
MLFVEDCDDIVRGVEHAMSAHAAMLVLSLVIR